MSTNGLPSDPEEEGLDAAVLVVAAPGDSEEQLLCEDLPTSTSRLRLAEAGTPGLSSDDEGTGRGPVPSVEHLLTRSLSAASESGLALGDRHVFILSDAGKPIFARHGNEEDYVVELGALQALISTVQASGESLDSFSRPPWRFIFLERSPLLLVAASSRDEDDEAQLRLQLHFLYYQILSELTKAQLVRIFNERRNFDLRRLLGPSSERTFQRMLEALESRPSMSLGAVAPMPLAPALRDGLSSALLAVVSKLSHVVFALVLGGSRLMTLIRMRKYALSPGDMHLILALVSGHDGFRQADCHWLPICLPRFDSSGFLHAYISYLGPADSPLCLVLLTADRDSFQVLTEAREKLQERLNKVQKPAPLIQSLIEAADSASPGVRLSELSLGGGGLWHFLYKNRSSGQLAAAAWEPPYVSQEERRRLVSAYLRLLHRVSSSTISPGSEDEKPDKGPGFRILFVSGTREALLVWVTGNFELYAALSPGVSKTAAVARVDRLMKWLKKEEDRLFILNPLVY